MYSDYQLVIFFTQLSKFAVCMEYIEAGIDCGISLEQREQA